MLGFKESIQPILIQQLLKWRPEHNAAMSLCAHHGDKEDDEREQSLTVELSPVMSRPAAGKWNRSEKNVNPVIVLKEAPDKLITS